MILVVDNYDSFTFNLVQYLRELAGEEEVRVRRNDAAGVAELLEEGPRAIVISPGPGVPERAGVCVELIRRAAGVPLLGVCLGHQALAVASGGRVAAAPEPRHGKVSRVVHVGHGVFAGLPVPLEATRYHSLVVRREGLPASLEVTAWTEDGLVMGLEHRERPHHGVQFHPESYLTREGKRLLANFLRVAGTDTGRGAQGARDPRPALSVVLRPGGPAEARREAVRTELPIAGHTAFAPEPRPTVPDPEVPGDRGEGRGESDGQEALPPRPRAVGRGTPLSPDRSAEPGRCGPRVGAGERGVGE